MCHLLCVSKIHRIAIDDAEYLDLVMPMYNLLEYSPNYSGTTGSVWFYSKDKTTDFDVDIANDDVFRFFKWKAKLLGSKVADGTNGILRNTTIAAPLTDLSIFWRSLEM